MRSPHKSFTKIEYGAGEVKAVPISDYDTIATQLVSEFSGAFIQGTDIDGADYMIEKESVIALTKSTPETRRQWHVNKQYIEREWALLEHGESE